VYVKSSPSKQGVVYLVRAANYDRVKVGYWTSTVKKLRSRYGTSYGFDFDLWYYPTPEPRKLEMAFKTAFVAHHVSAELYEAYPLDAYRSFFRDATDAD
jgi:hypothetical protein